MSYYLVRLLSSETSSFNQGLCQPENQTLKGLGAPCFTLKALLAWTYLTDPETSCPFCFWVMWVCGIRSLVLSSDVPHRQISLFHALWIHRGCSAFSNLAAGSTKPTSNAIPHREGWHFVQAKTYSALGKNSLVEDTTTLAFHSAGQTAQYLLYSCRIWILLIKILCYIKGHCRACNPSWGDAPHKRRRGG